MKKRLHIRLAKQEDRNQPWDECFGSISVNITPETIYSTAHLYPLVKDRICSQLDKYRNTLKDNDIIYV